MGKLRDKYEAEKARQESESCPFAVKNCCGQPPMCMLTGGDCNSTKNTCGTYKGVDDGDNN